MRDNSDVCQLYRFIQDPCSLPPDSIHFRNDQRYTRQSESSNEQSRKLYFNRVVYNWNKGGGPSLVVSTAAFHARVQDSVPVLGGLKETQNVSSPSTCETQYCGEPPWPRGSVLGFRPPGLDFRILCLEDNVISFISPSSGGSSGPV